MNFGFGIPCNAIPKVEKSQSRFAVPIDASLHISVDSFRTVERLAVTEDHDFASVTNRNFDVGFSRNFLAPDRQALPTVQLKTRMPCLL